MSARPTEAISSSTNKTLLAQSATCDESTCYGVKVCTDRGCKKRTGYNCSSADGINDNDRCASGICINNECVDYKNEPPNGYCGEPDDCTTGICIKNKCRSGLLEPYEDCDNNSQCASGVCVDECKPTKLPQDSKCSANDNADCLSNQCSRCEVNGCKGNWTCQGRDPTPIPTTVPANCGTETCVGTEICLQINGYPTLQCFERNSRANGYSCKGQYGTREHDVCSYPGPYCNESFRCGRTNSPAETNPTAIPEPTEEPGAATPTRTPTTQPSDTTSCENPATWSPGTSYSCQLSGCPEGGSFYDGPDSGCPASKPACCKKVIVLPPGAPTVSGYERSCVDDQISYKFNFTPGSGATYHKLQYVGVAKGDTTTVPVDQYNNYTSGMIIPPAGGNGFSPNIQVNYDILACNSAACTPDPQHWWSIQDTGSACTTGGSTPTGPCSSHGGVKTGTTAAGVCDKKVFNATDAKKTIAEGNPYHGKTYELRYTCNDPETYDYINPDTTTCNTKPWFDPPAGGGSTPGGTKTCYKDADNDGYGSSSGGTQTGQTTCTAGWSESNNDCYDQNASANPGQTGDFYVDRGDGSFDYNCNGQNDKKYATHGFGSLPTITCLADMPPGAVGFSNDMQCGTTGTFRLCYKFKDTACGSTAESDAVSDTIGRPCPGGAAGSGWALVDLASVPQNCK